MIGKTMIQDIVRAGLDVGSTTAKLVLVGEQGEILHSAYKRHHADVLGTAAALFSEVLEHFGDRRVLLTVTGSAGMGIAERFLLPFEQEVVAATNLIRAVYPDIKTLIDIGGEDAKMVFFPEEALPDMRMSGNCAGGTGAFIDQMATLLGCTVDEMGEMAMLPGTKIHPIASRCGVFSKTDIQNLIARNVSKADVSASVFHAVAVQTVTTLSHGFSVQPKVLFCGGPFAFTPALRVAFVRYLGLREDEYIVPENAPVISAWGAALSPSKAEKGILLSGFIEDLKRGDRNGNLVQTNRLEPLFRDESELSEWESAKKETRIARISLEDCDGGCYLGIDSGSTTTKIVAIDSRERIVFSYYANNEGNPIAAAQKGLRQFLTEAEKAGKPIRIQGSCSTGYGEDLLRAAFGLGGGIIETIAHYLAARKVDPEVSFILDIGGQDMKALFVENGALYRVEINEACSSGCGSFISAFAGSLQHSVSDFASMACTAGAPCDLGTRCTVFMNSKVKQFLREGASVPDISAGLAYSVVKNCLYKVLKLKNLSELGGHVVVQGGTMRNRSIVRAFEKLAGVPVAFTDIPELMGALGCALYAKSQATGGKGVLLSQILQTTDFTSRQTQCKGCENQCYVTRYTFNNGNVYYSGNKCEKVFTNRGAESRTGDNVYPQKYELLFGRETAGTGQTRPLTIGIPRILGMYEDYPFWHALFTACGFGVMLSEPSTMRKYETGVNSVMSDNICFPAKLAHSHILDLIERKADRIFYPFTIFEQRDGAQENNSFNCPVVTGYAEVLKNSIDPEGKCGIPFDAPTITFKSAKGLRRGCLDYLRTLGVPDATVKKAVDKALQAQDDYRARIKTMNLRLFERSKRKGELTVLLAGRPYHTDPLIQHKLSDMIAGFGVNVISEDIVRNDDSVDISRIHSVPQWSYVNRILKAAQWVAEQGDDIHFVQMTSFGCGPDAFLLDEVRAVLKRYGKTLTILKIDDVNNIGSLRLRVRSLIESLKFKAGTKADELQPFVTTKPFNKAERKRKLLLPHFSDAHVEVIEALFHAAGYDAETLPRPDGATVDCGLKYANNEVCYPATLVVGDMVKALESGRYDPDRVAVVMTQTGGQCRATNYLTLLKKAVVDAGYPQVPVISLNSGGPVEAGLKINWFKVAPVALAALLYGDCIAKLYYASVIRERTQGDAERLRKHYLAEAVPYIECRDTDALFRLLGDAAGAFDKIVATDTAPRAKVGVVGEIYLKLNSFSHKDILHWLAGEGIEVIPPTIVNFFMQAFVNRKVNKKAHLTDSSLVPEFVIDRLYRWADGYVKRANRICSAFRYYVPFGNIFEEADEASGLVPLTAQFGEGWLIAAEMAGFARSGVNHVISLQPFGCIANHIVSKGIEKKVRDMFPQMSLLFLDFDSGVSEVNVLNRLHLMVNNLKQPEKVSV
ncbi:MAG: acyl-CoA dehydratase activase-related protein [Rikenellaceae bacterium]|nr:acyl-CoA dehydratase activase-related protein [Rikenellaceae bacterium]MCC8063310.1 acyl-CoA dehydratase activase-related protein [Rikenellaceae bacterium]